MVDTVDPEQIEKFYNFIESNYLKDLHEAINLGKKSISFDFVELARFDHELADQLLNNPEKLISTAELAIQKFETELSQYIKARFFNLPESQKIKIRDIRSEHIGKFIFIEGLVRQSSDVRPQVISAKFECPACGNLITIPQIETTFKEPSRCSCGRRGRFRLISKDLVDAQRLVIEEIPESLEGGEQPKRLSVFLKEDLVEPKMEKRTTPGSKVVVSCIIKEIPIPSKSGGQLTRYDLVAESNHIEAVEETYEEIVITEEDERKIKELAKDEKIYEKLISSIAPGIYGHEDIKGALVLQLMGGVRKERSDKTSIKGDIHVLLVGDPGAAKSSLLLFISKAAPKSRYVAGRGVSAAGITASVVKDEFLRGWALEAGAIVLANGGLLCLHPGSSVIFNNRIIKIKDLFNEDKKYFAIVNGKPVEVNDLSGKVPSFNLFDCSVLNNDTMRLARRYYRGKILTITLKSGFELKLTPNHKLLSGRNLEWTEANKYKKGDNIIAPLKFPSNTNEVYIFDIIPDDWKISLNKNEKIRLKSSILEKYNSLMQFNKKFNLDRHYLSSGKQFTVSKFKEIIYDLNEFDYWKNKNLCYTRKSKGERLKITKITPQLAYIIGFILGDGHTILTNRRSSLYIRQSVVHESFVNKIKDYCKKIFNKLPKYYIDSARATIINGKKINANDSYNIFFGSNLLGLIYQKFTEKNLSNLLIFNDEIVKGFVAGCMDSDGYFGTKNNYYSNKTYKINHAEFDLGLNKESNLNFMILLRRFDCYSKLLKSRSNYIISITGRNDILALKSALKIHSLKARRIRIHDRIRKIQSQSDKIPIRPTSYIAKKISELNKSMLIKKGLWSTIYRYKKEMLQPSRDQLLKIKDTLSNNLTSSLKTEIDRLCKRDYFLEEIKDIKEEDYEGYVYDFYVPAANNFVSDSVFVHNCLDEMDKMTVEDTSALHEAMANQQISISKANIQATLRARTTVLAAANPKFGRFDPYQPVASQIDMPPTLINRFDLIFPVRDLPNKDKDTKIASHILELQQKAEDVKGEIPMDLLKKYTAYVRQRIFPRLTNQAIDEIKEFYVGLRNTPTVGGEGLKPIPISARQLEALVRLAEASARVRLSNKVTRADARKSISILKYCLMQVGFDYETQQIDIDRISTGIPTSTRNKIIVIREIIRDLEARGKKTIPIEDIMAEASDKNITEAQVEEIIEKLKKEGEIYEPRRGWLARI